MSHQDLLGDDLDRVFQAVGSGVQIRTTHITSAQLLELHNTPVELVPAPGPSQLISPLQSILRYRKGATPYTIGDATALSIEFATAPLHQANGWLFEWPPDGTLNPTAALTTSDSVVNASDWSDVDYHVEGLALALMLDHAVIDGDGSLDVTVVYVVIG